jgi:tyrosine-protein phosphatase SIW14
MPLSEHSNRQSNIESQEETEAQRELVPPENISLVCKGIYRSSFPKKKTFDFVKKLKLKSIL